MSVSNLPVKLRLQSGEFGSLARNTDAEITITTTNAIRSHTLVLPPINGAGALINDGTGILQWINPSTTTLGVQLITTTTADNYGVIGLRQLGAGSSSIRFEVPGDMYNMGIDQYDSNIFKLSHATYLGSSDLIKFTSSALIVPANLLVGETALTGITGVMRQGSCNYYACNASNNLFIGETAGTLSFTTAINNISLGRNTLNLLDTGSYNAVLGNNACPALTTGNYNALMGYQAGLVLASGNYNTAIGANALPSGDSCEYCVSIGFESLLYNTGIRNTAAGARAGSGIITGTDITCVGYNANPTTTALTNASAIGSGAFVNASNKIQLGNTLTQTYGFAGISLATDQLRQLINLPNNPVTLIGATAWTTLATINQALNTNSSPTFANLSVTGTVSAGSFGTTTIVSSVATVATSTGLTTGASIVRANAFTAPITLTLPPSATKPSLEIKITKVDISANAVTIVAQGSDVIAYGSDTFTLYNVGESVHLVDMGDGCWNIF